MSKAVIRHGRRAAALGLHDKRGRAVRRVRASAIQDVIRIIRLGRGEAVRSARKEIWVGIFDVSEVRAFARIEHLTVNADGRRATALGSLDHAVGGS